MQSEYIYPAVADRLSPKEWAEVGKPDLIERAKERKRKILESSLAPHIPPLVDKEIRKQFKIYF